MLKEPFIKKSVKTGRGVPLQYMYSGYPKDDIGLKRKYDKFIQMKLTEKQNRYKGVAEYKSGHLRGKWRAYTSSSGGIKSKHLGIFSTKEEALKSVDFFYSNHKKVFME